MRRLLIRSVKTPSRKTRVDILFQNTNAICLPTDLEGVVISVAAGEAAQKIRQEAELSLEDSAMIYAVKTQRQTGYVVASIVAAHEDDKEYFEPSYFR